MTQSRFFQTSLLFPLGLWLAGLIFFTFVQKQSSELIMDNLYSAYRIFVPYVVFAALVWKLVHNKPYKTLIFSAFIVPITWGLFFTLCYVLATLLTGSGLDKWYVLCIMAFWAMLVAYLFEIIPLIILSMFKDDFKPASPQNEQVLVGEKDLAC
ncbi:MAG: hypothetical protein ACYC69_11420 [Thermodesulfovibrionales bacterium]